MPSPQIGLTFTAVDQTSKTIAAINDRVEKFTGNFKKQFDQFAAPIKRTQEQLARFGQVTGINRVASGFRNVGRAVEGAYQRINQLIPVMGLVGSAASVAGVARMTSAYAEWGLRISQSAQRIGIGARQLSSFQGAAKLAGSDAEAMTGGLQTLGQALYDVQGGRNVQAGVMLRTLFGPQFQANAHDAMELMPKIADKIASIRDPFAQAQVGTTLFGGAWEQLAPILTLGSRRMADLQRTAEKYNPVTNKTIETARDLALAQSEVGLSFEGLRNRISERLAPVLIPMLEHFADWVATSPVVAHAIDWIGGAVQRLGQWIQDIDWGKVGDQLDVWGNRLLGVVKTLQSIGLLPKLDLGGDGVSTPSAPPMLPPASPLATPDDPAAQRAPDTRHWWERFYKPGPGLLDGVFGPAAANPQAPNGVPRVGPNFGPQITTGPIQPSAFANNNPTNLQYYPGQPGVVGQNGRWGVYDTAAHGIGAGFNQMLIDQRKGFTTLAAEITHRSSPSENDTAGMIRDIAGWSGIDPNAALNLRDPDIARRFMQATIRRETGRTPSWSDIDAGISPYLPHYAASAAVAQGAPMAALSAQGAPMVAPSAQGAPLQLATGAGTQSDGKSTVRVEFAGDLPKGLAMNVRNPDKADVGGPLVDSPYLLGAMP